MLLFNTTKQIMLNNVKNNRYFYPDLCDLRQDAIRY